MIINMKKIILKNYWKTTAMDENKEKYLEIATEITKLKTVIKIAILEYCNKKYIGNNNFDPIEWTQLIISSSLGSMFEQLEDMGKIVNQNEGKDLYSKKVQKFHEEVKIICNESMKDLHECFLMESNIH
jgi:hypothetical protein